jgi:hypothetical protein
MRRLERRIQELEARAKDIQQDERPQAFGEFLRRLTVDELRWLLEPTDEGQRLVLCPHVESLECGCRSEERRRRAMEVFPEIEEKYLRRRNELIERHRGKGVAAM